MDLTNQIPDITVSRAAKKVILTLAVLCGIGFKAAAQSVDTNAVELIHPIEIAPQFPGGYDSLRCYLLHNLQYPEACHEATGKVYVGFTVETDGTITEVELLRGICSAYNEEALRIVRMMPRWVPGRRFDGTIIRVRMNFPIDFFPLDYYR